MPEGPELKHSRDRLKEILVGQKLLDAWPTKSGRYKNTSPEGMERLNFPLEVKSIDTKGKFMWWTLSSESSIFYMWCTYGMSGQWTLRSDKHAAFVFQFNRSGSKITRDYQHVYFVDPRHFGTIKFIYNDEQHKKKLSTLGPDILSDVPMTAEVFAQRILSKPNRVISEILMDQSCVSGVGNYLRAEALWVSSVSPWRKPIEMSSQEICSLHENLLEIAKNSYESGGATIHTYKNVDSSKGSFVDRFAVYGRKFDLEGNEVKREVDAGGRTIHWSPNRQK